MKKGKINILIVIGVVILVLTSSYFLSSFLANYRLELKDVYIAKVDIRRRRLVDKSYLTKIKVPKAYLNENVYIDEEDIVGKYVISDGFIAKGSLFYKDYLQDEDEMEDAYFTRLNNNETAYDLRVKDIFVNTASLKQGQYLDIYLTINRKEVISDLLIKGARVVGVYDNQNKEVINNKDANIQTITIAIDSKMIPILNKALAIGEIRLTANSNIYDDQTCTMNLSEEMLKYLS